MPVVKEIVRAEAGDLNTSGSTEERGYIVDCPADGNPRLEPGVPQIGQYIAGLYDSDGLAMPCNSVRKGAYITRYSDSSGNTFDRWEVFAVFESPRLTTPIGPARPYREWSMRFAREAIQVPFFYRVPRIYANPNNTNVNVRYEWQSRPYQLDLTFTVFEQVVYVTDEDLQLPELMIIRAEVGRIHHFGLDYGIVPIDASASNYNPVSTPGFVPTTWDRRKLPWRFEPPLITMVKPKLFRIQYAWVNDPGNQNILDESGSTEYVIPQKPRPPFHRYDVQFITTPPQADGAPLNPNATVKPIINVVPIYPPGSGWINPEGWQQLPGNPIS
jgi:hypothetical protein